LKKLVAVSTLVVALVGGPSAVAKPGDLIAGNASGSNVLRINVKTGDASVLSADSEFSDPSGIAFDQGDNVFVADYDADPEGAIFVLPQGRSSATFLAGGDPILQPIQVEWVPDGFVYASDNDSAVVNRINPNTGALTSLLGTSDLTNLVGIDAAQNGSLYVGGFEPDDDASIVLLNPRTGTFREITSGPPLEDPYTIDVAPNGKLFVGDDSALTNGAVIQVNPKTGAQDVVSEGGLLSEPLVAAVHPNGKVYVADFTDDRIISVNPKTSAQKLVSADPLIDGIEGMAVEPPNCDGRVANIVGSNKKDKLKGSRFADVIAGLKGNDKIKGLKGHDRLCGGKGKDKLKGGPGKDKLNGGPGKDKERQ
jgi:DNA-binding beta-propeller fold protein YncE